MALARGKLQDARTSAEELVRREPRNFEGFFWSGYIELQRRDAYEAIRWLRRAEALDPNAPVLKVLAVSYYAVRQYRLFRLKMTEAIEKEPADFAPYYYLGRYYDSEMTDFTRAAEYFVKAIQRSPGQFRSHYYLGYCFETQQNLDQAEREYQKAAQLAEDQQSRFSLPSQGLARLRLLQNRPGDALSFARRAVELGPRDPAAHKLLARVYTELGKDAEAIPWWERAAALDPTDVTALFRLFRACQTVGDKNKAATALVRYRKTAALYGTN